MEATIIALDIGNSLTKIGIFRQETILQTSCIATSEIALLEQQLNQWVDLWECEAIVISNVGLSLPQLTQLKEAIAAKHQPFIIQVIDGKTNGILENTYLTSHTLGSDRWAAMNAAAKKYPKHALVVVSLGTALTLDFANAQGQYLGGIIAPGILMRYRALHDYTQKLPLLNPTYSPSSFIGKTTESAIHIGVIRGLQAEIEYFVNNFTQKSEQEPKVLLSGGDIKLLPLSLKNISYEPNLVLEGIYYLYSLNLNAKEKT